MLAMRRIACFAAAVAAFASGLAVVDAHKSPTPLPAPAPAPAPVPAPGLGPGLTRQTAAPVPAPSLGPGLIKQMTAPVSALGSSPGLLRKKAAPVPAPGLGPGLLGNKAGDAGFITVLGNQFVDYSCREYVFSGANVWNVMENAADLLGSKQDVDTLFKTAQQEGLNVLRVFAFGTSDVIQLQTAPGQYNPQAFAAMDYIIALADAYNVKLTLVLADNWKYAESKQQYVAWAGQTDPDSFYTDPTARQLFQNHIKAITRHVNKLTGRTYSTSPGIFAYDLMNEPRAACDVQAPNASCTAAATKKVQGWIEEMSAYLKQQDPNHLVTVGEEGFYGPGSSQALAINPNYDNTSWATKSGQNFTDNHSPLSIDFAAIHIWPANWEVNSSFCGGSNPSCGNAFVTKWITAHQQAADGLGKPLVVEEFGDALIPGQDETARISAFAAVYQSYLKSLQTGSGLKGVSFWQFEANDQDSNVAMVDIGSATWNEQVQPSLVATQQFLSQQTTVPNCVPGKNKAMSLFQSSPATAPAVFTFSAGRRLLAKKGTKSARAACEPDFVPVNSSMQSMNPGFLMDHVRTQSAERCARACRIVGACQAFSYKAADKQQAPNCKLWTAKGSKKQEQSNAGYQTFWRLEVNGKGCATYDGSDQPDFVS